MRTDTIYTRPNPDPILSSLPSPPTSSPSLTHSSIPSLPDGFSNHSLEVQFGLSRLTFDHISSMPIQILLMRVKLSILKLSVNACPSTGIDPLFFSALSGRQLGLPVHPPTQYTDLPPVPFILFDRYNFVFNPCRLTSSLSFSYRPHSHP